MNAEVKQTEYQLTMAAQPACPRMTIVIHSMGMPFDGDTVRTASLGGSESAAYYQARELASRGHRVMLFTNCKESSATDGVMYLPIGEVSQEKPLGYNFELYARNTPHDVLIIQRHPLAFHGQFASKINIWQLHDLALIRSAGMVNAQMWNVDAVTCVSEWHKKQVCEIYGFDPEFVRVVPNGVDEELYSDDSIEVIEGEWATHFTDRGLHIGKQAFNMLYQSRPERGLEHLVRPGGIMDRLRDTNAHLLICGYENTTAEMAPVYQKWFAWADALPNVTRLGALTKPQLAALQKSCDLLCYPTAFEEVSCITAMEAMHAGLPIITSHIGALPETLNDSGSIICLLKDGKIDENEFVNQIIGIIDNKDESPLFMSLRNIQIAAAVSRTWSAAVDKMEAMLADLHTNAQGSDAARLRHCIEHSDIDIARAVADFAEPSPIVSVAERELKQLYAFTKSAEAYAAHYDKHQSAYYDEFREQVIGEDVRQSARFRAVRSIIGPALDGRDDVRVLDYGCAHGHYLMPLAAEFPKAHFTGMDISARAIGAAMEWAKRANITNVELIIGDQSRLAPHFVCPREKLDKVQMNDTGTVYELGDPILFDIIYAGEVLEHVPDWLGLLEQFRTVLKPRGLLIITTPLGRWEWTGTAAFREAREHLHHFDKDDILELCGANTIKTLCAPAGADQTGRALGSWVWGVTVNGPFEPYNVERKLDSIVPRQTVSACLIVKDGERTLRKCVESIVDWVDEVVIAIDPTTKDRTQQIAEQLQVDYQWRAFTIVRGKSAIKDGFDAARNVTLEHASGDWILWLDADEEVQQPQNLWKYLRQSQHQAFGFPQVHYACDPPQVLTTDYPCRLFRNNGKIKFYGVVHEHPEVEAGKAIPFATIKTDVQFLHAGYVDESVRRKRYERNLPLLTRDIKQHPERKLNTFLWLRDIAQGIMFHVERQGGYATEAQVEQAREGIKVFEKLVDDQAGNMRMILDSVPYYSQCVMLLQSGFDVDTTFKLSKPPHNDLNCNASIKGRFHSIACYEKLLGKLTAEATKHYESKYL